jgi:heterodisulfide reductase subunit B
VTLAEDPEYPMHMDEVAKVLGCEPVMWNCKTDCCGSSLALPEIDLAVDLTFRLLRDARDCGAEAVVVACPLCQMNLDTMQDRIGKAHPRWDYLPVIYLSQLVGRAIGVQQSKLGLEKHIVNIRGVMA